MGWNDHIDPTKSERDEFLETLLKQDRLVDPACGVAKLVLSKGEDVLTEKQRFVYEKHVLGSFAKLTCKRCLNPIPLNEAICALEDNDGYCGYCADKMSRDD